MTCLNVIINIMIIIIKYSIIIIIIIFIISSIITTRTPPNEGQWKESQPATSSQLPAR